jgi:hypothetical protein
MNTLDVLAVIGRAFGLAAIATVLNFVMFSGNQVLNILAFIVLCYVGMCYREVFDHIRRPL